MTLPPKQDRKLLPTLAELNQDIELAFKNDQFKLLLNQQPPESWLKKQLQGGGKYVPIDKTEFLLDRIFQDWRVEVLREGVMFNSVYVTVRVHYKNPVTGEWSFHDGVGAKDMQKDAGTTLDMSTIKSAAVMMALPSAKSFAIKDACDHLGKIFGRDLNRKDTIDFAPAYSGSMPKSEDKENERVIKLMRECKTRQQLSSFEEHLTTNEARDVFDEMFKKLK
jgi:hypothetical protein